MTSGREYDRPAIYEIRAKGRLDARWSLWFADLAIVPQSNGESLFTGPICDQAALYGVISRMRDLGLVLISVHRVSGEKETDYIHPDREEPTRQSDSSESPTNVETPLPGPHVTDGSKETPRTGGSPTTAWPERDMRNNMTQDTEQTQMSTWDKE